MHVFDQLLNQIPEIIIVNNEKVDLGLDDNANNNKTVLYNSCN